MTYLLEHRNRHAAAAGYDGFWGYRSRLSPVTKIVIHTSESTFDQLAPDTGAEAVANYLATGADEPASYHRIVDADTRLKLLPFSHTAFGARGFNANAIHLAVAGTASKWHTLDPDYRRRVLDNLAADVTDALEATGVPLVRIAGDNARGPHRGICGHVDLDPARRTDPGPRFPWTDLFAKIKDRTMLTPEQDARQKRIEAALIGDQSGQYAILQLARRNRELLWTILGAVRDVDRTGEPVDVDALAGALADQLNATDAQALADELARRLAR